MGKAARPPVESGQTQNRLDLPQAEAPFVLRSLTPHLRLDRVTDIRGDMIRALGVEALLVDLDGTLKDYYESSFPADIVAWVAEMRDQVRLCMLTNGRPYRVQPLADRLGIECVAPAYKPLTWGVRAALARLQLDRTRVAIVGDQLFADVLAGRRAGIFTILVPPISPREPWITGVKRPLERWLLRTTAR
jgi:hypothetical protein